MFAKKIGGLSMNFSARYQITNGSFQWDVLLPEIFKIGSLLRSISHSPFTILKIEPFSFSTLLLNTVSFFFFISIQTLYFWRIQKVGIRYYCIRWKGTNLRVSLKFSLFNFFKNIILPPEGFKARRRKITRYILHQVSSLV